MQTAEHEKKTSGRVARLGPQFALPAIPEYEGQMLLT